jgi:uncharacterized membrane protein YhaH (DUF805 family)
METSVYLLLVVVAVAVIYLALMATYHTILSSSFDTKQKAMIVALVWLVPVIGPLLIISVFITDKSIVTKSDVTFINLIFLSWIFSQNSSTNFDDCGSDTHNASQGELNTGADFEFD